MFVRTARQTHSTSHAMTEFLRPMRQYVLASALSVACFCLTSSSASAADPELQTQNHDSCIVDLTGDVNVSGAITSADIIYVLNYIFLIGPPAQPCAGSADVNCSGQVSAADVIYLVGHVFKSGPEPCNICESAVPFGCIQ